MDNKIIAEKNWKRLKDFDVAEQRVIEERSLYESIGGLADVFRTTPQTINAIIRRNQPDA